jgi:hypothetical protein
MNEYGDINTAMPTIGRGRGRGGGIPVLPTGSSLLATDISDLFSQSSPTIGMWESLATETSTEEDKVKYDEEKYADSAASSFHPVPSSRHHQSGTEKGSFEKRGPAKDLKGVDWNCPQCDNLNWSWRNKCNKCNTAKPMALNVSLFCMHLTVMCES